MATMAAPRLVVRSGTVVTAGTMDKTVKVRSFKQKWNNKIRKYFKVPHTFLVHDPNNSCIEGDYISAVPENNARRVHFTVNSILAPFAKPVEERPPLMTKEEREAIYEEKRAAYLERRDERVRQGIRPAPGKGKKRPRDVKEILVDDDGLDDGAGKGPGGKGRVVLSHGLHKFGGINEEAQEAKRKIMENQEKSDENVKDRQEVKETDDEEYQKEALGKK